MEKKVKCKNLNHKRNKGKHRCRINIAVHTSIDILVVQNIQHYLLLISLSSICLIFQCINVTSVLDSAKYWVSQKVHSGFSVRCYGKPQMNSLANPIFCSYSAIYLRCFVVIIVLGCVQLFATPWAVICQTLLSMEFPGHKQWSRLPFPIPGDSS